MVTTSKEEAKIKSREAGKVSKVQKGQQCSLTKVQKMHLKNTKTAEEKTESLNKAENNSRQINWTQVQLIATNKRTKKKNK